MLIEVPDIEVSVECDRCKCELDADFNERTRTIKVEPCVTCMDTEREAGRNEE